MPRGRRYRRMRNKRRKKNARKRSARSKQLLATQLMPNVANLQSLTRGRGQVISNKITAYFRYADNGYSLNPTAANISTYSFRANDLNDPDQTGVGHQPRGFDQLVGTLFDHFQVIASTITITLMQHSSTMNVGIVLSDNSTGPAIQTDALEWPSQNSVHGTTSTAGPTVLKLTYSQKKFFGTGSLEEQWKGAHGTTPTEGAHFVIYAMSADPGVDPAAIYFKATIDYIAVLTEPKVPSQS